MKKKIILPFLLVCLSVTGSIAAFRGVFISGPDSRCYLQGGSYGEWSIEDYEPGSTFQWYVNDADSRDQGYPSWSWGRPCDTDALLEESISFEGYTGNLDEVMITCKITTNGVPYYEGFVVYNCN